MSGDIEVTAVFGFLAVLRNVCLRFPDHTPIVLWDSSPSWRVDIYPDYKANRKDNPTVAAATKALRPQRPIIKDLLKNLGVRQYTADRYEADDLAADLSKRMSSRGGKVVLVTRDADWQQLINEHVIWYDHKNDKIIHDKNFQEETGYKTPSHFVHGKSIHGDTSDNIPGVGGLGEGAARLILSKYDSLTDLFAAWLDHLRDIKIGTPWSRYKTKIATALNNPETLKKYALNLKLMDLGRDYSDVVYQTDSRYDKALVKGQFAKLGFHSLLSKYDKWLEPLQRGLVGYEN